MTESPKQRRPLVRFRHRQRRHPKDGFSSNAERLPAGRDNPKFRAAAEKGYRKICNRFDKVLAIVKDEQHLSCREVLDEQYFGWAALPLAQVQCREHCVDDRVWVGQFA
ncbi:hypothetical protein [Rhodococcus sp. ACS1]|uniref:hypothetical protein n=1 Tax=Rhodococcus sp. ACS1 TaxID=2028570 RepID=UPI00211C8AB3|nr:hypothetical protein [Rhodococcus sp. ACS1]